LVLVTSFARGKESYSELLDAWDEAELSEELRNFFRLYPIFFTTTYTLQAKA
jgi:hypothetical protein